MALAGEADGGVADGEAAVVGGSVFGHPLDLPPFFGLVLASGAADVIESNDGSCLGTAPLQLSEILSKRIGVDDATTEPVHDLLTVPDVNKCEYVRKLDVMRSFWHLGGRMPPPASKSKSLSILAVLALLTAGLFWLGHRAPEHPESVVLPMKPPTQLARPEQDPLSPVTQEIMGHDRAWAGRPAEFGRALLNQVGSLRTFRWSKLAGPGNVAFRPPDQLITFMTFAEPGSYLLRLTASHGDESLQRDVSVTVAEAPFDSWRQSHFGAGYRTLPSAADHSDADTDGISNLMEYALMLDPKKPDVTGLPDPAVRNGQLSMMYKRPLSAVDLGYQVQWTEDMFTWHSNEVSEQVIMKVGDLQIVRASTEVPVGKPGRFLRLRVIGP